MVKTDKKNFHLISPLRRDSFYVLCIESSILYSYLITLYWKHLNKQPNTHAFIIWIYVYLFPGHQNILCGCGSAFQIVISWNFTMVYFIFWSLRVHLFGQQNENPSTKCFIDKAWVWCLSLLLRFYCLELSLKGLLRVVSNKFNLEAREVEESGTNEPLLYSNL